MHTTTDRMRDAIATMTTPQILDALDNLDLMAARTRAENIAYAIMAAAVARRLNVDPDEAVNSSMGPANYLRMVHDLAA